MFNKKTRWLCASDRFFTANEAALDKGAEIGENGALCMLARREVKLAKHIKSAYLTISADDYYSLWLNGQFVGQGPASCYPQEQYVQRYDVSKYVKSGMNLVAVQVHYNGKDSVSRVSGNLRQGFIMELEVDGELVLITNDRFRCLCPAGARFAKENDTTVEILDARAFPMDWMQPKFNDESWTKPTVKKYTDYEFVPQTIAPDLFVEFEAVPDKDGIYDLEEDYTGILLVKAQGVDGSCLHFCRAKEDGSAGEEFCRLLLNGSTQAAFSLPHRLRRIKVVSENGASVAQLSVRVFRYGENEEALSLKTVSGTLIDCLKKWKSALEDDALSAFDAPGTDADEGIAALARSYLTGEIGHFAMALKNMALSQSQVKTLLVGAPASRMREDRFASLLFVRHAYLFSLHSPDKDTLETLRQAAGGVVRAFATYARKDGLLESSDETGEKHCPCRLNALYVGALMAYDKICEKLGEDSGVHAAAAVKVFNEVFFDAENGEYREDNIYPMYFGLLPRGSEFRQTDKLKSVGARRDEYYRLKSLCLAGGGEEALRQILLGETSSPEAALCVFVEDILGVNPKVIGGEVWLSRLGEELGNVSVRVKAFGHKALYTRKDGFATLKL